MALTSGTPLPVLTAAISKAGWGDLGQPSVRGLAVVLTALGAVLNPRSGTGYVTAPQLADRCCYTERWVRRCLTLLEELDLIEWHRGGIQRGAPVPSWIRVNKAVLVDLIRIARRKDGERLSERRRETRTRVVRLRTSYTQQPGHRKRRRPAPHAELPTALLSSEEVTRANRPLSTTNPNRQTDQKDDAPASPDIARSALARMRADLAAIGKRSRR